MGTRAECVLKNTEDKGGSKMFKKCFALLTALVFFTGSISVAENKNILPLPSLQRSTDTGYVSPNADNTISLGTPLVEFKNGYFDGTMKTDWLTVDSTSTFTGDVSASADSRTALFSGNTRINLNVLGTTTIVPTGTFTVLVASATLTMNATPIVSAAGATVGDYLILTTTANAVITLTETGDSDLVLGGTTRDIGPDDTLFLVCQSTGSNTDQQYWQEISYVAN